MSFDAALKPCVVKALQDIDKGESEIILKDVGLSYEELLAVANALKRNLTVRKLDLSGNATLDARAGDILRSLLEVNAFLDEIDLSGCSKIGPSGISEIANGLRINMTVRTLHLRNTEMGGYLGTRRLSSALRTNKSLENLDLRMNGLGVQGAKHLAKALVGNTSLQFLNISENDITDDGAVMMSKTLRMNRSLEKLDMWRNGIGEHGASHLREAVRENSVIQTLNTENVIHRNDNARRIIGQREAQSPAVKLTPLERRLMQLFRCIFQHQGWHEDDPDTLLETDEQEEAPDKVAAIISMVEDIIPEENRDVEVVLPLRFSPEAFRLAHNDTELFVWCIEQLAQADCYSKMLDEPLKSSRLWLQEIDGEAMPMAHLIMSSRECDGGVEKLCEAIFNHMTIDEGRKLFKAKDSAGRTFRSLASGHASESIVAWAKGYGTYLLRYDIVDGPPVHESKTCAVHFATDILTEQEVALKIMKDPEQFRNELISRDLIKPSDSFESLPDVIEASECTVKLMTHVVPIVRAHCADRCVVMPRATRSLFEAINTEQFVSRQLGKIRTIAYALAIALQELQEGGRIHADIKPRNFVRVSKSTSDTFAAENGALKLHSKWFQVRRASLRSIEGSGGENSNDESVVGEDWQLIDLDASVAIGSPAGLKHSSGYCPPELARELFPAGASGTVVAASSFDVWSFGAIFYQMLSGTKLFMVDETDDNLVSFHQKAELINWITIDRDRLARIHNEEWARWETEYAKDLVRGCLMGDPKERLTIDAVLKHPFFTTAEGKPALASAPENAPLNAVSESKDGVESYASPKDATKRILSFRVKVEPAGGSSSRAKGFPLRRRAELEMVYPQRYHFFLSHMQKEAAGIVKDLYLNLTEARCLAWIDMHAEDLTQDSMRHGVENSSFYLLVLTTNVLFRPFCVMELFWAITHHGEDSDKKIVFVVEEDGRFSPWDAEIDVPWISDKEYEAVLTKRGRLSAEEIQKKVDAFKLASKQLRAGMQSLIESDIRAEEGLTVQLVMDSAKKYVTQGAKIPYRRRGYEEAAMIEELLALCSYSSPHILRDAAVGSIVSHDKTSPRDVYILYHESGASMAKEFANSMKERPLVKLHEEYFEMQPQVLATAMSQKLQRRVKPDTLLIILLKDGFFKGGSTLQTVMHHWICEENRPFIVLQYDWSFGGPEQEAIESELRAALFDFSEIVPYRKLERHHEHFAMLKETKRRLMLTALRYETALSGKKK